MTRTIVIQEEQFEVSTPYAEGHTLTEPEARALNQTRCENIRNNFAKKVKEAKENGTLDEVRRALSEYDAEYSFAMPSAGGSRKLDPIEREARAIARDAIKTKLAEDGRKVKDIEKEAFEAAVAQVAERPDVIKLATKRVSDKQKAAETVLEGIAV